jgi:hypothetical protein
MAFTDLNGIPYEYNSPTYTSVVIRALKVLADHVQHDATRIRARTMAARLGLSVALHIHAGTGRWAGPHSRAYQPTIACTTRPESEMVAQWIADGALPEWIHEVIAHRPAAFEVIETAFASRDMGITTYHSPSFALGVSSKEFTGQSNVVMVHYQREGADRPGVLYTRYLVNDKWLGDFYHATDRTRSRNLIDEGRFYGVQQGPSAIGLYTPRRLGATHSAKGALIWSERELVDEIWIADQQVHHLPASIPPGQAAVIGSGGALIAVWPLTHTDLGRDAPVRLAEVQGDLVLEIHNYLGPEKRFWEMGWPGAFYRGTPQCGFYLEAAERTAYPDGQAFLRTVRSGTLRDVAQAPFVYAGNRERLWSVQYARGDRSLGIEVDLMEWKLKRRWTQDGEMRWPMLASPLARETRDGHVEVGDAVLVCRRDAAWLYANPKARLWVAAYHGLEPAPLTLTVPDGQVHISGMGAGTVVWDRGVVRVEAVGLEGQPAVTGGRLASHPAE